MKALKKLCPQCFLHRHFCASSAALEDNILVHSIDNVMPDNEETKGAKRRITELLWQGERERYNKSFANRKVHVTAVNTSTEERSIVELSLPKKLTPVPHVVTQSNLPVESLAGLKSAIAESKQHPKVIQNIADLLGKHLDKRKFPATSNEIKFARKLVMEEIAENDVQVLAELQNPRGKEFIDKLIYKKAQKVLSHLRYNWKPLSVETRDDAAAFALSRLSAYYAEMERVLSEFDRNGYVPKTILDYGSGCGSAFWAANARWGNAVRQYCLVDENFHMRNFSMDIMRGTNYNGTGEFVNKNVYFRKNLVPSPQNTYDIVILHRTLIEIPSHEDRMDLINTLWKRTNKYMIIVDSPMEDSFKAVMQIRDYILTASHEFDFEVVKNMLDEKGQLDMKMIHFLADKRVSQYEKFCVVQEKLSMDFKIPTKVEQGFVFAPCPHDQGCPKLSKFLDFVSPCKFKVRWTEKRADYKTESFMKDGTLTGKFCYMILEKGERPRYEEAYSRILAKSKGHSCSTCTICTPSDGLQTFTISRRGKPIYHRMKNVIAGQCLPVDFKIVKSSSGTQFIRDAIENVKNEEDPLNLALSENL